MKYRISVYTRSVDPDRYPAGLANSIHLACTGDGGERQPLNRDYGILFARGVIAPDNTIVPYGVKNPGIFAMEDGRIGITGERVYENGEPVDDRQVLLWTTRDLIRFEEEQLADRAEIEALHPADALPVEDEIAERAILYWNPIRYTSCAIPEPVRVKDERELDAIRATLFYSDGSERSAGIRWDREAISFDRPGTYAVRGEFRQQTFRFPLANGYGDPVLFPWEGKWYYISTNDNLDDIGLYVREADRAEDLFAEGITEHLILPFDPERGFEQTFWAPEFHVIGGELYLLFAVSGHTWGPQCHMMKLKKGRPIIREDSWEDPVRVLRKDGSPLTRDAITLDMTFVRGERASYVIWSYREFIGTPKDSGSMLYIAAIDEREPWRLVSDPVLLTRPLFGWENVAGTINNEGPHAFIRDGRVYLTYSGGSANSYTYALGLLTARTSDDLLDLASWDKSMTPVLTFYSVAGEYGPGHNSFFTNDDGDLMIAYHAETAITERLRCDGIRRVHFRSDGTPYFQMSTEEDATVLEVTASVEVTGTDGGGSAGRA
ncbi:MAG: family 43 glycosylhydrolase [Lachnospiraceae bacterium]|nr:family 43 glycosylhydrolase [Lachnospiraceae bacterium]